MRAFAERSNAGRPLPYLPGSTSPRMQVVQHLLVLERVHAHPETIVFMGDEVSLHHETLEGFVEEFLAVADVPEDVSTKDEIAPVDPKPRVSHVRDAVHHRVVIRRDKVVADVRLHGEEARDLAAPSKLVDLHRKRRIGEAIAVIRKEHVFIGKMSFRELETLADIRGQARIYKRDLPIVDVAVEQLKVLSAL